MRSKEKKGTLLWVLDKTHTAMGSRKMKQWLREPLNHVEESPLKPSSKAAVAKFQKILEDGGVTATVRRTLGGDIDASCGQLRRKYNKEKH